MNGWEDQFKHLTAACGGKLNPETLTTFQLAMAEYEVFMDGVRRMFAPRVRTDAATAEESCKG